MAFCPPKYTARDLRTPCEFQAKTKTSDGAGGWTEAWSAISGAATRCQFKALSGGERYAAQRVEATTRNRIVCRYFDGLKEADKVVIDGRSYAIVFINNVELRNRWFEIDLDGGVAP